MDEIYENAVRAKSDGDEEVAFKGYSDYSTLVNALQGCEDFESMRQSELEPSAYEKMEIQLKEAMYWANKLSRSLKKRYQEVASELSESVND